jgi:hypothetical protein
VKLPPFFFTNLNFQTSLINGDLNDLLSKVLEQSSFDKRRQGSEEGWFLYKSM